MKEQLYTIPVNDAFESDFECPLCFMKRQLEKNAIEYTLGPSYMEDDTRAMTDKTGFCEKHISDLYNEKNRLGLALIMSTHMEKVIKDMEEASSKPSKGGLLFKKSEGSAVYDYTQKLSRSCFVCDRIDNTFDRYINTVFQMYKKDDDFKEKMSGCKGFCTEHYGILYDKADAYLSGDKCSEFKEMITKLYLDNLKRVKEDIDWFINKFDYRYQNEPWKNSKDALPRTVIKMNSVITPDAEAEQS